MSAALTSILTEDGSSSRLLAAVVALVRQHLPLVLVLVSGWLAAQVTWQLMTVFTPPQLVSVNLFTPKAYQEELLPGNTWQWSTWRDLYAKPPPKPEANQIRIAVQLKGILGTGKQGIAMLKVDKKKEALYSAGDELGDGVKLEEVNLDSVKIRKGTATRVVQLVTKKSDLFLQAAPPRAPEPAPEPTRAENKDVQVSVQKLNPKLQVQLNTIQQKVQADPTGVAKDFALDEVKQEGALVGYRLKYKIDPMLLLALGLRPTDVIKEVNGIPVSQLAGNPARINALMGLDQYRVVVERNDRLQTLVIRP